MDAIKIQIYKEKGFTMMEIMVVVFILVMFMGLAASRFNMGSERDISNQVKDLALLGRHLRAQARIHNRTYRLTFELPEERDSTAPYRYLVEYSSRRVLLPGNEEEVSLGTSLDAAEVERTFVPADKIGDAGDATLTEGLRVNGVELSRHPQP